MNNKKNVCIGMPIYNGENYIKVAINSILKQDYTDLTLIISDNGSTDNTAEICKEYAAKDPRVKFHQNETNLGAVANFMKVVDLADPCDYFAWCAHDDLWHKSYLRKCLEKLEEHPEASLCCTYVNFIDLAGNLKKDLKDDIRTLGLETLNMSVFDRLIDFIRRSCLCIIFGVFRYEKLKKIGPLPKTYGGDFIFLLKFLLTEDVVKVPEYLFYYRYAEKTTEEYLKIFSLSDDPRYAEKPFTNMAIDMIKLIFDSDLNKETKTQIINEIVEIQSSHSLWTNKITNENPDPDLQFKIFLRGLLVAPLVME